MLRSVLALSLGVCALGGDTPDIVKTMNDCTAAPVVLQDVAAGWGDDCRGLEATNQQLAKDGASTAEACKKACYDDSSCAVWQFIDGDNGGCYTGVPKQACRTRSDFKATAGQRVQHGTIKKIKDATGMEVMGLMPFKMTTGDELTDEVRCKNQCYSDVTCGVWQFSEQTATKGCWVEHLPSNPQGEQKTDTQFSTDVKFGEFVEHVCPPPPKEPEDKRWLYALIAGIVALLGLCILCYMLKKKPKTKKTRAVKIEPKKEPEPTPLLFLPQPTVLVQQPMVYQQVPQTIIEQVVPQTTYVAPQTTQVQQVVAAPQTSQVQQVVAMQSQPLLQGGSVMYR